MKIGLSVRFVNQPHRHGLVTDLSVMSTCHLPNADDWDARLG